MNPDRQISNESSRAARAGSCTDPVVGAILAGWRYDISSISPEMRTDYEQHLFECAHCKHRQRAARTIDVLLLMVSTLSILAFLLAAVVIRRIEILTHIDSVHVHLRQTAVAISLEAAAIAGLVVSTALWILVAVATPLPGYLTGVVQQRLPSDLRQRFSRHAQNRA
ncbi:hypothetical protein [Granulicella tundricola]|uniref:Uncharacterized protein n=1 Tax=Granulicella tundricola (strain ATCC BAA-1859 / DSM 23138 / MP5ACTX9) TaxID=1198114 RepID=E8X1Q7_GRATM|nr:hypothetical protein [Granulicella tundricola]ADW67976.1 hypothetical protein AciX9_0909 [Granulicella tundricola MP5ACTX9]